ncbi:MAG: putative RDD family membrane protein YckC [Candidatus Aldehydirespiratoraceae bacterium]|jgi:uncharacterized RDD family membrane protein YckC
MNPVIPQTPAPPADPTAVLGRRTAAWIIDFVLLSVITIVAIWNMASSEELLSPFAAERVCEDINDGTSGYACVPFDNVVVLIQNSDILIVLGIIALYGFVTQAILPGITGFSPGKAMVGLRIVKPESFETAGLGSNLGRYLLWIVDSAPWCFPLVGLITGLSSNGHRRVGDMVAKTLVIDKKWVGQPLAVPGVNSVPMMVPPPTFGSPPPPTFGSPPPPTFGSPPPPPGGGMPIPPPPLGDPTTAMPTTPPSIAPPATPPAPPVVPVSPLPPEPVAPSEPAPEPAPMPEHPTPPATPEPPAPPEPEPVAPPGVDAPQWDDARDTYIQYDPELAEWMEWSESQGTWIPISR